MLIPPHPRGYVCVRAKHAPQLTGRLDDPAWLDAPWSLEFVDIEGEVRPKPWFRTRVKMLWDDDYFYVGAEMEEPHVWATQTVHDCVIFHENDFEVFIDPDGDNHDYYEYEINALGTDWDLRLPKPYRDGGPALNDWEIPGLKKAVHVSGTINDPGDTDKGWSMELAFPWKVLGEFARCPAPPRPGHQWRVNFSRVQWDLRIVEGRYEKVPDHPEHNWVWSPQGVVDMHRPETWGYVQFEDERKPFRKDSDWDATCKVMSVYWAQRTFKEAHGRYAATSEELGTEYKDVHVTPTETGYRAGAMGAKGWVFVREDSLLSKGS